MILVFSNLWLVLVFSRLYDSSMPDWADLVLALKLWREFLGSFPVGARGIWERAAEGTWAEDRQHPHQEALQGKAVVWSVAFTYSWRLPLRGLMPYQIIMALAKETWEAGLLFCCVCNDLCAISQSPLLWHLLLSNSCTARLENNHQQEGRLCCKKL